LEANVNADLSRIGFALVLLWLPACGDGEPTGEQLLTETGDAGDSGAGVAGGNGAGGAATVPNTCPMPSDAVDPTAVIDDMEDQNELLPMIDGRTGGWWTAGDGTSDASIVPAAGTPTIPEPVPGGRCGSKFAMRVTSQDFTEWGSMLGLTFIYGSSAMAPYDASSRRGITFWARIGDTSTNRVRLAIGDVNSEPAGGVCSDAGGEQGCYDTFGVLLTDLDRVWKRYEVPFEGLSQQNFGLQAERLDVERLYTIHFMFEPGAVVDLGVDDISFY
jgi:hypothetical protein